MTVLGGGTVEIDELRDKEAVLYEESKEIFGKDAIQLIDDAVLLYSFLAQLIQDSKCPPRNEVVIGGHLLLVCQYQLFVGSLDLLRGHYSDALGHLRQAIEAGAFARRIKQHPNYARIYVEVSKGEGEYKKFREKFAPKKIFPANDTLLQELQTRYDLCSRLSHASFYGTAHGMDWEKVEGGTRIGFQYFSPRPGDDGASGLRWLAYILQTHHYIIRSFEIVLEEPVQYGGRNWIVQRDGVFTKFRATIDALRKAGRFRPPDNDA